MGGGIEPTSPLEGEEEGGRALGTSQNLSWMGGGGGVEEK